MIFWTTFGKIQGITFLLIYLTPTTSNQPQSQVTFLPLCASRGHQDGQLLSSFFAFQPLTWSMSLQFRWLQWWTRWKKKRNGRSEHFFSDCAVRVNMGYAPWHTSSDSTPPFLVVVPTTFHAPHVMSKHQRPTFCSSHGDKRAMLCDVPVCLRLHWIRTAKAGHWTSAKTKSNQKDFTKSRATGTSNEFVWCPVSILSFFANQNLSLMHLKQSKSRILNVWSCSSLFKTMVWKRYVVKKCLTCGKFGYPSWISRAESVAVFVWHSSYDTNLYNVSIFAMIITVIIVVVGAADTSRLWRVGQQLGTEDLWRWSEGVSPQLTE